jgi:signal transduction histidine kinase/ligand-binding sensor domain-containing protein/DNA-binding response OmpR family regulator
MRKSIFIFLACISASAGAQPYVIKQLDIRQGLSNNYVVGIAQDRQGFLWFATEEGLNKFDGARFINYYKHDRSITGNELNGVYADPDDPVIWIATQRNGLNAYNYVTGRFTAYTHADSVPQSLSTNDITDVAPAADGNLWIGTYHRGVDYLDKQTGEFRHYNSSTVADFPCDNVWTVADGNDGRLYIGHVFRGLSVLSLSDRKVRNYVHIPGDPHSLPDNEVKAVYKDSYGNIWVGTNRGLALFNPETGRFMALRDEQGRPLSACIYSIDQLDGNKLWIGTELNGVYILDLRCSFFLAPGQMSLQHIAAGGNRYNLSNSTVRCVFQDSFKNIWIGTYGGGIDFIGHAPPLFRQYSYSPLFSDESSLSGKVVSGICADDAGRIWIGTDGGGINLFENGKRLRIFRRETGELSHNSILSAFKDSGGNLWFGTFQGGVNFYDMKKKRFAPVALAGRTDLDVRHFYEDSDRNLWIATSQGVHVLNLDDRRQRHFNKDNSPLLEDLVRSISKDAGGRLWIGTFGAGIGIYSPDMKLIRYFDEANGFCSNTINHIITDSCHRIWAATGAGLVCFPDGDSPDYRVIGRNEGLLNTYVRAITEDEHQNIWFSTNAGVSCYRNGTDDVVNYNRYDNTHTGNFTSGSVTRDQEGNIYFGSINGALFFNPDIVSANCELPPVIITEMKVFGDLANGKEGKNINLPAGEHPKIELGYKENTFNITFNIQDHSLANRIEYAYTLQGLEEAWYTVNDNQVMFRNIPPGRYGFRVKARMHNQEWDEKIGALQINITPPLWLTWWAKLIYGLAGTAIAFALLWTYKKRMDIQISYEMEKKNHEKEQELNNERLRFYTNITHELRTPLTLILGPLEDMQQETSLQPKHLQKLAVVHQSAVRLLNLINQILEFRKTETQNKRLYVDKGNIAAVVQETGLKYKELNRKPEIDFKITVEHEQMPMLFDKEAVTIILDNLISNAVKYTEKGAIDISLYTAVRDGVSYTEIKVSDTGYGITPEALAKIFDRYYQAKNEHQASGTGIGLALVKNLVALHEGEIRVESHLNQGSSFYVSFLTHHTYPDALHADASPETKPAEETAEEAEGAAIGTKDEAKNGTKDGTKPILLVVEDHADIRDYIADSLKESFEVLKAENGEAGIRLAQAKIPDVIVSDIMMPVVNGIAFCKIIKEDVRTSHIPVILLTAKDSLQDREEGYQAGADSYLTKPFSATLLHSRINNLLESRKKLVARINSTVDLAAKSAILNESLNRLDNEFLQRVTELIEEKLDSEKVDITYLSDKMYMSSSTLYRKMKALTGSSTSEYVRKVKVRNAERLLLEGKYNISEVAFKVGINSPAYFRQCFKDEFGISPADYLKQLKCQ